MDIYEAVTRKNWPSKEKEEMIKILGRRQSSKASRFFRRLNFALILVVLALGNVALSFVLIPLFVIANELTITFFLVVLGLAFGIFTDQVIYQIEQVPEKYYAVVAGFLPVLVVLNFYIMTLGSNIWAGILNFPTGVHNPLFISILYAVAYMMPFVYRLYTMLQKK